MPYVLPSIDPHTPQLFSILSLSHYFSHFDSMNDRNDFISIRNHQTKSFPDKLMDIMFFPSQKWFLIGVRFAIAWCAWNAHCLCCSSGCCAVCVLSHYFIVKKYRNGFLSPNKLAATRNLLEIFIEPLRLMAPFSKYLLQLVEIAFCSVFLYRFHCILKVRFFYSFSFDCKKKNPNSFLNASECRNVISLFAKFTSLHSFDDEPLTISLSACHFDKFSLVQSWTQNSVAKWSLFASISLVRLPTEYKVVPLKLFPRVKREFVSSFPLRKISSICCMFAAFLSIWIECAP